MIQGKQAKPYSAQLQQYAQELSGSINSPEITGNWNHSPLQSYLDTLLEELAVLPSPQREEAFVAHVLGVNVKQSPSLKVAA